MRTRSTDHLRQWREGRTDRFHIPSAIDEGGLASRSLPGPTALAREYLSETFSDRYRRRAADNGLLDLAGQPVDEAVLREQIVKHLASLPAEPGATRPYRDMREVAKEPDDLTSLRGRRREQWLVEVTRSTRANLPRHRSPRPPRPRRAVPLTPAQERGATRRRVRYDETEAIRRALHAYVDGFPHHDAEQRARHRASVPVRAKVGDVVAWVLDVIGLWESRWQDDKSAWPEEARHIGAPRRPIAFPGPRVTAAEVRRAHSRVRRARGYDYLHLADYLREEMRSLVRLYDLIGDLEQSLADECNPARAKTRRDLIAELRDAMLDDSVAHVATAWDGLDHVAA